MLSSRSELVLVKYIDICNGNSRARAYAVFGDYREEDPACYL
jgi:MoaA/NifB/PqqE/SkfB family radical SAM enzyme